MQGKIIGIKEDELYLEVDEQLRFHSRFVAPQRLQPLHVLDRVNFSFVPSGTVPCIKIQSVEPQVRPRA
ncbi:hypothetical protein C3F09_02000 [candidate division GN15 bacterium]|uniref:Uncharacterized protein n=1 Tax=candidate division GN15 bacterium TaxID=2072418 RepID=A0A855X5H6_9BACT|nr:MAG: hypothetical protein C3F09_02000 [candidate division GN15 bacterium]